MPTVSKPGLIWPTVEKAAGSGERQTLDPLQATTGVVVEVPQDAVVYPGEQMVVYWGEPGTLGARRVEQPISPGQRRFQIDMPAVAAYMGKTASVCYGVIDENGQEHPSIRRVLQVGTIPSNRFEAVRCDGLSGGNLSYRTVVAQGARLSEGIHTLRYRLLPWNGSPPVIGGTIPITSGGGRVV